MKLSKSTLEILKNFATINPGIILKKGNLLMTKSINSVIFAEANIQDALDMDVAIYDLSLLLGITNALGSDADITEVTRDGDPCLRISSNGRDAYILQADASSIVHPKKQLNFPTADVIFEIKADVLGQLEKMAGMIDAEFLRVRNENGRLIAEVCSSKHKNNYQVDVGEYDGTATFSFYLAMGNMKLIPDTYAVKISHKGAIRFEGSQANYIVALEAESTYTA